MRTSVLGLLAFFCGITLIWFGAGVYAQQEVNLALKANNPKVTATQSSANTWEHRIAGPATKAIDGDIGGGLGDQRIVETKPNDTNAYFEVDLGNYYRINKIIIHPRTDNCCTESFKPTVIVTDHVLDAKPMVDDTKISSSSTYSEIVTSPISQLTKIDTKDSTGKGIIGRYIRLQMKGSDQIELAEIEIFGDPTPVSGHTPDTSKAWTSTAAGGNTPNSSTAGDSSIDPKNLARNPAVGAVAKQSTIFACCGNPPSNSGKPELAIDGKIEGIAETNTVDKDNNAWFELDLKNNYKIDKIVINSRNDDHGNGCCRNQFHSVWVIVTDQPLPASAMVDEARIYNSSNDAKFFKDPINGKREIEIGGKIGRYIRLQTKDSRIELQEIEVYGEPTPVAGYTPDPGKAWDAALRMPFDPNFPNFLRTDPGKNPAYWGTLQGSPKIILAKNSATSFDVAYQDLYGTGKTIRINTYETHGTGFKKNAAESATFEGMGTFAGFAKDAGKNRYVFTSEPWTGYEQLVKAQVFKINTQGKSEELWNAKYFAAADNPSQMITGVKGLMNGFHTGTSRLVTGGNSLLITTNIFPTHPYQVILDTTDNSKNVNRAFFQSLNHHNFGQRAIFDGTDFVIMENRDHDVTVSLTKLSTDKVLPLIDENLTDEQRKTLTEEQKWKGHPGPFTKRLFSVYSHTNMGNHTYTELGNVETGFGDNGYLVLFSGERDWNYKMTGYTHANPAPNILSPRDIGLVHVKKDFEKEKANWVDAEGNLSMCPMKVDNSSLVNSTGEKTIINYRSKEDGWDWAVSYNADGPCKDLLSRDRTLETKGVKWVTNYGANKTKAEPNKEFTSVNHPKLVRIAQNKYVAVWEEWTAKLGDPKSKYLKTKAALITLKAAANGEVNIELTSAPKDLGSIRLMPGDDAFEFDGKAAWAVGDVTKGKIMFYTIDAALNLASYELEL